MNTRDDLPWWRQPFHLVLIGFLAIASFFLVTEHTAHVFDALPFLLLLACPLMHMFMHHGYGGHGGHDDKSSDQKGSPHQH